MTQSDSRPQEDTTPPGAAEAAPADPILDAAAAPRLGSKSPGRTATPFESTPSQTAYSAPPQRNRALWAAVALLFVLTLLSGGLAWLAFNPDLRASLPGPLGTPISDSRLDERLSALDARIDAATRSVAELSARLDVLDRSVARLNAAPAQDAPSSAEVADLRGQVQTFTQRLEGLSSAVQAVRAEPQAQDLSAEVTGLAARLDQLAAEQQRLGTEQQKIAANQQSEAEARQRIAMALAIGNLEGALLAGRAYPRPFETVRAVVPPGVDLSALAARADAGVPTGAELATRFPGLADQAVRAERQAGAEGWLDRLWARLRTLVIARPVGEVPGTDTPATLARAQARLDSGNLAGAVQEVETLKGPAAEVLAPWLEGARARIAVEAELAALRARLLDDLARRG